MVNRGSYRSPWEFISLGLLSLSHFNCLVACNAELIRFGEDAWRGIPFALLFLWLYRLSRDHSVSIASMILSILPQISWNFLVMRTSNEPLGQ